MDSVEHPAARSTELYALPQVATALELFTEQLTLSLHLRLFSSSLVAGRLGRLQRVGVELELGHDTRHGPLLRDGALACLQQLLQLLVARPAGQLRHLLNRSVRLADGEDLCVHASIASTSGSQSPEKLAVW